MNWGKKYRLLQIQNMDKYYCLVALDHGLTLGAINGIEDINQIIELLSSKGVTGFVINSGMIKKIEPSKDFKLIYQIIGVPDLNNTSPSKVSNPTPPNL